jgi:hypothetical protein
LPVPSPLPRWLEPASPHAHLPLVGKLLGGHVSRAVFAEGHRPAEPYEPGAQILTIGPADCDRRSVAVRVLALARDHAIADPRIQHKGSLLAAAVHAPLCISAGLGCLRGVYPE